MAHLFKRSKRGTILAFLLILAIIGLMIILWLIASEFFTRYVTLGRIQAASQVGALSFARELVKLRDNEMGFTHNYELTFDQSLIAQACQAPAYAGCTPLDTQATTIGPRFVEYVNASQLMLFQLSRGFRDASEITNLMQGQCYIAPQNTRFASFGRPPTNCNNIGQVLSPITDLTWEFRAARYGTGICARQADPTQSPNKDFCVEASIRGRLDPIFAGGLPFLRGISFIGDGDFLLTSRAVVMRPNFIVDAGTASDRQNRDQFLQAGTQNYSAEAISAEACNSNSPVGSHSPCTN